MRVGEWVDPRQQTPFPEFANQVMDARVIASATRTRDTYHFKNHVLKAFNGHTVGSITRSDVQAFVSALTNRGSAPRTVRDIYGIVRLIMKEAEVSDIIRRSPCYSIKLPRIEQHERKFLTVGEIETLADYMDDRYRAMVYVCSYLGLRWEEVAALKRSRVNILKRQVVVAAAIERDGNSFSYSENLKTPAARRTLPMPAFLAEMLALQIGNCGEFVFSAPSGGHLHYHNWRKRFWMPAVKRAGLAPLGVHELRHTAAAIMIDLNVPEFELAKRMGHSNVSITHNLYGHLYTERHSDLAKRLDDVRGAYVARKLVNPG